jgi:hypothetical protein
MMSRSALLMIAALLLGSSHPASSAVVHDESLHGDISGNRSDPTSLDLGAGVSSIIGAMGPNDLEYFRLVIPVGLQLDSIVLSDYGGDSFVSFLAVQRGTTFTVAPDATSAAGLLGWTHFSNLGADLLAAMSSPSFGSEGFSPPLPAGAYTFWMQEVDAPVQYRLDFNVSAVPEPATWIMLACGLGVLGCGRRFKSARAG